MKAQGACAHRPAETESFLNPVWTVMSGWAGLRGRSWCKRNTSTVSEVLHEHSGARGKLERLSTDAPDVTAVSPAGPPTVTGQ